MKRIIALLFACVFVLSMASCKGKEEVAENSVTEEKVETKKEKSETADKTEEKAEKPGKETPKKAAKPSETEKKDEKKPESTAEPAVVNNDSDVKMEDNKIINTVEDEDGNVTVQEYVYDENKELSDINVTIKFDSEDEAKEYYESVTNGDLKEEYDNKYENVELNGDCIQAEYKEERVEPMKALEQEQMYLILNSAVTTYEIKE